VADLKRGVLPASSPSTLRASGLAEAFQEAREEAVARAVYLDWARDFDRPTLGKEDWLFIGSEAARAYHSGSLFSPGELDEWCGEFVRRQRWLAEHGIGYLVVLCPDKATIYPQFLPQSFGTPAQFTRADQLIDLMRQHPQVDVLDLRDVLRAARTTRQCFHKTDSHWNDFGAYVGYCKIIETLNKGFPVIQAWPLSDFHLTTSECQGGDLAELMGLAGLLREATFNLLPVRGRAAAPPFEIQRGIWKWSGGKMSDEVRTTDHPDGMLPRAVIFHDSMGFALNPFLAEHFSRAFFRFTALGFEPEAVERERPDIVIQLFVERRLATEKLPTGPPS
jgi:hypothetical protein